jgi:hypothetical protein
MLANLLTIVKLEDSLKRVENAPDLIYLVAHRVGEDHANKIIQEITSVVRSWPDMAKRLTIPSREVSIMKSAFRVADAA